MNDLITKPISNSKREIVQFATNIATAWHKATESILEVGRLLLEAEKTLPDLEYRELERGLADAKIMSSSTISKLRKIAGNSVLTNPEFKDLLPRSYETLYKLSFKDDEILEGKFRSEDITSNTIQKEVVGIFRKEGDEEENNITKNKEIKDLVTFKINVKKLSEDQLPVLKNILKQLEDLGIEISGLKLD